MGSSAPRRMSFSRELERDGRYLGLERADTMEFAYRRRYSMPATDPRYLDSSLEDIVLDYWAHRFWDEPKLREEVHNPDFEEDVDEIERLIASGGDRLPAAADLHELLTGKKAMPAPEPVSEAEAIERGEGLARIAQAEAAAKASEDWEDEIVDRWP